MVKVETHGEGIKVTVDEVSGDGSKHAYSYTAKYDGKDNPVTGNPMDCLQEDR
jgi:predicted nucleic acid-binding protein